MSGGTSWTARLAAVTIVTVTAPALAQEETPDGYREVIDEAVLEFDARRFAEARALFRRAHELAPSARTLRGIGLASFEMRDYVGAFRALRASLRSEARPLDEAQRAEVSELLERTERFLGIYTVNLAPVDAALRVDGEDVELEPDGQLVLALGEHTLHGEANGHEPLERALTVIGGEREHLVFELVRVAPEPRTPPDEAPVSPPPSPSPPPASADGPGPLPIFLLASGGAAVLGSVVTGLAWWLHQDDQLGRCAPPRMCSNEDDVRASRDAAAATTITLATIGAGMLTVGAVVLGASDGARAFALHCGLTGVGLTCAGRF